MHFLLITIPTERELINQNCSRTSEKNQVVGNYPAGHGHEIKPLFTECTAQQCV
jgi:hypothetical protein